MTTKSKKIRKLSFRRNLDSVVRKEFNSLRISNIEYFLSEYGCNDDYYKPPFKILSDLEQQILFKNNPKEELWIEYKPMGYIIFWLKEIKEEDDLRVVVYEFITSAS